MPYRCSFFSTAEENCPGELRNHRSRANRRIYRGLWISRPHPRPHRDDSGGGSRRSRKEWTARTRRSGLSYGTQVEHGFEGGGNAEIRHLQCRRRRSRRFHGSQRSGGRSTSGSGRHAHCRLCGGRFGGIYLRPSRVSTGHQATENRHSAGGKARTPRVQHLRHAL